MEDVRRDRRYLAELEEVAAAVTGRAGAMLLERYGAPISVEFKDEKRTDPVTEADRAVEAFVRSELLGHFPAHGFLGEEGTLEGADAEYLWVLDPLDGTANFAGRLPFFGVSLALLRNGVTVVGCLFVPFGPRLRAGVLRCSYGNGASIDGDRLRLPRTPFRPTGPVALPPAHRWAFQMRGELAKRPGELRNLGSICYELAMVVGGGFQYAAFVRPRIWDVAAGALLVREAGGAALTWDGRSWRSLERFVAPPLSRRGKPTTLRDWGQAVLVGAPCPMQRLARELRVRPAPPLALRWAFRRQRDVQGWWRRRTAGSQPKADRVSSGTSTASGPP
ncbi:MAG: inositol monophosphatase [Chloroflexi bacterium]|nr:inositol monophosphatase [Chloroflexota bacterium]